MNEPFHLCTFKPGQHRTEAWQAPRGHRVVHVDAHDCVHAFAVPKQVTTPHTTALLEAQRIAPGQSFRDTTLIDPDLIDLIK